MAATILECEHACLDQPDLQRVTGKARVSWVDWLWTIYDVRRQRRDLLSLNDRMLADIGLSRADAYREGSRGLYDLPEVGREHFRH